MSAPPTGFGAALAGARRVLVMELAGLGDNVHLLPALWALRRHCPEAELHVMVNAPMAALFELTPWVQRVWPYPTRPKPGLAGNLRLARELRAARFDALINTTGSDRSSLLAWATRVPLRAGRRPADGGPPGWSRLYTHVMEQAYYAEPMYLQKWRCLRQLGIADQAPAFHVRIDPALRRAAGIAAVDEGRYLHVSPFTTAARRELSVGQMAELLGALQAAHPQLRLVVSCSDAARERDKLAAILAQLATPPWKVFAGTLSVPQLAAVIEASACHFSGDTGSLHVALMAGARAVAWFRHHRGEREWIPIVPGYRVLLAEGGAEDALHGIATTDLLAATRAVLAETVDPQVIGASALGRPNT